MIIILADLISQTSISHQFETTSQQKRQKKKINIGRLFLIRPCRIWENNTEDFGKGKEQKRTATTFNGSDSDSRESIDIEIPLELSSVSLWKSEDLFNSDSWITRL